MKQPWMKFHPTDWRGEPRLRACSLAARGLWIDLICYMHEGMPYGHLTIEGDAPDLRAVAAFVGRPVAEVKKALTELEDRQVLSRTAAGVIFSRRMVRDHAKAGRDAKNGLDGGNPNIERGAVPKDERIRGYRRSDAPNKTRRIWDKSGGRCHWCGVDLIWSGTGTEANQFHVDHIIAVKDGGTNDEANLVAAGVMCNRKRAGLGKLTCAESMGVTVGTGSDDKAKKLEARTQTPEKKEKQESESARVPRAKPKTPLPDDWKLDDVGATYAHERGYSWPQIEQMAEAFADHHRKNDSRFADWAAAWRTWVRNEPKFRGKSNGGTREADRDTRSVGRAAERQLEQGFSFGPRPGSLPPAGGEGAVRLLPQGRSDRS